MPTAKMYTNYALQAIGGCARLSYLGLLVHTSQLCARGEYECRIVLALEKEKELNEKMAFSSSCKSSLLLVSD